MPQTCGTEVVTEIIGNGHDTIAGCNVLTDKTSAEFDIRRSK